MSDIVWRIAPMFHYFCQGIKCAKLITQFCIYSAQTNMIKHSICVIRIELQVHLKQAHIAGSYNKSKQRFHLNTHQVEEFDNA